jgi:hypothetical protein
MQAVRVDRRADCPASLRADRVRAGDGPHIDTAVPGAFDRGPARPVGMQAHPALPNTPRRDRCAWLHARVFVGSGLDAIAETALPLARFGSGGDPRSDGCRTEHRDQGVIGREGIFVHRDPSPLEPP